MPRAYLRPMQRYFTFSNCLNERKIGSLRRLKIMPEDYNSPVDPFGTDRMTDALKAFCREQGMNAPEFWIINPDRYYMGYATSLHLSGKDRWEEFDAKVIFLLRDFSDRENREAEERLLNHMFEELGEPVVLTVKAETSPRQQLFFKHVGLMKMPVTWADYQQNEYVVYAKGKLEMGGFVNLMERIEYIGKEIVYKEEDGK